MTYRVTETLNAFKLRSRALEIQEYVFAKWKNLRKAGETNEKTVVAMPSLAETLIVMQKADGETRAFQLLRDAIDLRKKLAGTTKMGTKNWILMLESELRANKEEDKRAELMREAMNWRPLLNNECETYQLEIYKGKLGIMDWR